MNRFMELTIALAISTVECVIHLRVNIVILGRSMAKHCCSVGWQIPVTEKSTNWQRQYTAILQPGYSVKQRQEYSV